MGKRAQTLDRVLPHNEHEAAAADAGRAADPRSPSASSTGAEAPAVEGIGGIRLRGITRPFRTKLAVSSATRNETPNRLRVAALRKRRYHEHGSKMPVAYLRRIGSALYERWPPASCSASARQPARAPARLAIAMH